MSLIFLTTTIPSIHAAGGPGNALVFFESDFEGFVSVPHDPALNAYPFTVTAWINAMFQFPDPLQPFVPVISKSPFGSDGWSVQMLNGGIYASYGTASSSIPGISGGFVGGGQWRHVAFAVDSSGGRLYLDGVLQGNQPWVGTAGPPSTTAGVTFGSPSTGPDFPHYQGFLEEITIWNAALSQAQIQFNMNRSLTGMEPGLIAYYRCDESGYGTSVDSAPAAGTNHGTWFGAVGSVPSGVRPFTPFVETLAAGPLGTTNVTLNGVANAEGADSSVWFQWGITTNYGSVTPPQAVGSGIDNVNFSQAITGLVPDVNYQYRAVASNTFGVVFGTNQSIRSRLFSLVATNFPGVYFAAAGWGDYDNDGRLDILLTGATNNARPPITQVWKNTETGFININASLRDVLFSSAAWGDYDNDGRLDILLAGDTNWVSLGFRDLVSQVWRNDGNGFMNINAGLPPLKNGSIAWGDYDNDGRTDILLSGGTNYSTVGPIAAEMISQIWRNTGSGFANINAGLPGVDFSSVAWADYDNDGRLDFLLSGRTNLFGTVPITQVWRNTGDGFTNINAGLPGVTGGACAWGDYDNDGRLDLLLTGHTNYTSLPAASNIISQVWRNTGNGFTNINAGLPGSTFSSVGWGDYDNDGRLDILLAGATNFAANYHATGFVAQVWRNTGTGFTGINTDLPGVFAGSCAWGDYDNDGRLDILFTGGIRADRDGNILEAVSQVWRNNLPQTNTPPTAPTNLTATVAGNTVTFGWGAAGDLQTPLAGLTYNLRVGTAPGASDIVGPMAATNGWRRLPQGGNAGQTRFRTMALPAGPLYWSVQAVDGTLAGGAFSAEGFIVVRPSLTISQASGSVLLSWPANAAGYTLEATPTLLGNPWLPVTTPHVTNGNNVTVSNPVAGQSRYYRLHKP